MAIVSLSNTWGHRRMAAPMLPPWFTSLERLLRARLNRGLVCWAAIRSRLRTIGTPASTRAASLLAKRALSRIPGFASRSCCQLKLAVGARFAFLATELVVGLASSLVARMPRRRNWRFASRRSVASTRIWRALPLLAW